MKVRSSEGNEQLVSRSADANAEAPSSPKTRKKEVVLASEKTASVSQASEKGLSAHTDQTVDKREPIGNSRHIDPKKGRRAPSDDESFYDDLNRIAWIGAGVVGLRIIASRL